MCCRVTRDRWCALVYKTGAFFAGKYKKFRSSYTEISVERTHSRIRNPAWNTFLFLILVRCPVPTTVPRYHVLLGDDRSMVRGGIYDAALDTSAAGQVQTLQKGEDHYYYVLYFFMELGTCVRACKIIGQRTSKPCRRCTV